MAKEVARQGAKSPLPRYVVVVDSDRRSPNDRPSATALEIERKCRQHGFPCWLLAKREAENYLPRELLSSRQDVGQEYHIRVDAWDGLTGDQKDYYDMKEGFPAEPTGNEMRLYRGLSDSDRKSLAKGFGDKVGQCWSNWEIRGDVASAIRKRGRGDVEQGLEKLRKGV